MRCGIFVGGASRRMGRPKGTLCLGDETLLARAVRVAREAGLEPCLLGEASAYVGLVPDVARVPDAWAGVGPLGGLRALVAEGEHAIGWAVDMPYVDASILRALASYSSDADVLLPRRSRWEPLCARWRCAPTAVAIDAAHAEGSYALQPLVARLRAEVFELDPRRLDDWDCPEDVP
ncbi:MAG: NTP transferase domain-containing protein [Polyangiales bacterium]